MASGKLARAAWLRQPTSNSIATMPGMPKASVAALSSHVLAAGCTSKAIDQNVGIEQQHLGGTLPSLSAHIPRELGAISDVGPVSPHSEEFGFCEIAERPGPGGCWRRDDQNHFGGTDRKIRRQRDMKFTARWDLCIQIDSPGHRLPFCVASCHYNLLKITAHLGSWRERNRQPSDSIPVSATNSSSS